MKNFALDYAMKKRKKMADGGEMTEDSPSPSPSPSPAPITPGAADFSKKWKQMGYAEGGQITDNYQPSGKPHVDKKFGHEIAENASGFMDHEGDVKRPNSMAIGEDDKRLNQHKP